MNPQEFSNWWNDESKVGYDASDFLSCERRRGFLAHEDAAYSLLSKEISEKDEEISGLKKKFVEAGKFFGDETEILRKQRDYWKQRSEAAERLMIDYDPLYPNGRKKDYNKWQELKDNQL